jgi:L-fuconolactonase
MSLIDSHCHASPIWYEPVETLVFQMDRVGVAKAVLVQVLGQADNSYQAECVKRFPGRFANVVGLDAAAQGAGESLQRLADDGAKGVRLRPDAPEALWQTAQRLKLSISCVGTAASFLTQNFADRLTAFADVPVVLEHLGGWARPDCDGADETRAGVLGLARFPNIHLKVPGLGQLAKRGMKLSTVNPLESGPEKILLEIVRDFGAHRLMWGSDFPPVASREGYANALHWTREALSELSQEQQAQIFGGTAARVFSL